MIFILFVNIILCKYTNESETSMVVLKHPHVKRAYQKLSEDLGAQHVSYVSELKELYMKKLCILAAESPSFFLIKPGNYLPEPYMTDLLEDKNSIESYFESKNAQTVGEGTIELIRISRTDPRIEIPFQELKYHTCTDKGKVSKALLDLMAIDRFYIILKNNTRHGVEIARVEPIGIRKRYSNYKELQKVFYRGTQFKTEIPGYVTDVYKLNKFKRFQLCSSLYPIVKPGMVRRYNRHYIREPDENTIFYVETHMDILHGSGMVENIKMPLLVCAINQEWNRPSFYVAIDLSQGGAVFIHEASEEYMDVNSEDDMSFQLTMHVTDVDALKDDH